MAPPRKWTRQSWIDTATKMVDAGASLGEVKLQQLLDANGAAKNSFYNGFPGGLAELHAEVIEWWKAQRVPPILQAALAAVENPVERLRILRSILAGNAVRDEAMRRWAATDPDVEKAVASGDKAIGAHAIEALHLLGYRDAEAEDWAEVIVAVIQTVRPRAYETMLGKLDPTGSTFQRRDESVAIAPGEVPDELIIYRIAQDLPPGARRELRASVQHFASAAPSDQEEVGEGTVA